MKDCVWRIVVEFDLQASLEKSVEELLQRLEQNMSGC